MSFAENRKLINDLKIFEAKIPQMVSEMGGIALNHFTKSFYNQGFTDETLARWKPRKQSRYRTRSGKIVDDTSRGILIGRGTGNLRKLRKLNQGSFSVIIKNNESTNRYARVHNEGLRSGRGKGFTMPKRQFIGYSHVMSRGIEKKIIQIIKTVYP